MDISAAEHNIIYYGRFETVFVLITQYFTIILWGDDDTTRFET